jgi:RHS repeat-associated protein
MYDSPQVEGEHIDRLHQREGVLSCSKARYYNANIGRFVSEDPLRFWAGETNFYPYVGNEPTRYIDSEGLDAEVMTFGSMLVGGTTTIGSAFGSILVVGGTTVGSASLVAVGGVSFVGAAAGVAIGTTINDWFIEDWVDRHWNPITPTDTAPIPTAHFKEKGRNWATEKAKERALVKGTDPCEELQKMLDEAKCNADPPKIIKDIQQAQKFLGCRHSSFS